MSSETESWKPPTLEQKAVVPLTNIDLIEKEYLEEYDRILQKDKAEGKDFNILAYNDLKKA